MTSTPRPTWLRPATAPRVPDQATPVTLRPLALRPLAWLLAVALVASLLTAVTSAAPGRAAEPSWQLVVGTSPDRTSARPLDGQVLPASGDVYISLRTDQALRQVKFFLDDSDEPTTTDKSAPFDLGGTADSGAGRPFDVGRLRPGTHTLTAAIKLASGVNRTATSSFSVGDGAQLPAPVAPSPSPSPSSPTSAPSPVGTGQRPTEHNTGVPAGLALSPKGSMKVTKAGTVLDGLDINGVLTIAADDVTVRNSRVSSMTSSFVIDVKKGFSGTLIENVSVHASGGANGAIGGLGDHHGADGAAVGDNVTVRRSKITGYGDGIKVANYSLYEGNYIRMARNDDDKHVDGIQASGRTTWTARGNTVAGAYAPGHNSAIFLQAWTSTKDVPVHDVTIEDNWVDGGVYTIQTEDGKAGGGWLHNIRIEGNVFGRGYLYGPYRPRGDVRGNGGTFADTGAVVPRG